MKKKIYYSFSNYSKKQPSLRKIEIEKGERLSIRVINNNAEPPIEEEIMGIFMPGVLTLEWEMGAKIEDC